MLASEYAGILNGVRGRPAQPWLWVGPPTPDVEPSPRRFIFSQPISELREKEGDGKTPPPDGGRP